MNSGDRWASFSGILTKQTKIQSQSQIIKLKMGVPIHFSRIIPLSAWQPAVISSLLGDVQFVQSFCALFFLLPSEVTKTKTCAPLALHEDHKPGNTNGVFPASRIQQCFSKAALHGHGRSWLWNISLLECWRQQLSERLCEMVVLVLYFTSLNIHRVEPAIRDEKEDKHQ